MSLKNKVCRRTSIKPLVCAGLWKRELVVCVLLPSGDFSPEMQHKTEMQRYREGVSAAALLRWQAVLGSAILWESCRTVYCVWLENKYKLDLSHLGLLVHHHFCNVESESVSQKLCGNIKRKI